MCLVVKLQWGVAMQRLRLSGSVGGVVASLFFFWAPAWRRTTSCFPLPQINARQHLIRSVVVVQESMKIWFSASHISNHLRLCLIKRVLAKRRRHMMNELGCLCGHDHGCLSRLCYWLMMVRRLRCKLHILNLTLTRPAGAAVTLLLVGGRLSCMQLTSCRSARRGFPIPTPCAAAPLSSLCICPGLFEELVELRFIRKESKNRIILQFRPSLVLSSAPHQHSRFTNKEGLWPHNAPPALLFH